VGTPDLPHWTFTPLGRFPYSLVPRHHHLPLGEFGCATGDPVYVRTYVCLKELSHKLIFPAAGPLLVKRLMPGHHAVQLQTTGGAVTVPIDRVRKCTAPADLPQGMRFADESPGHFSESHQDPAEESFEEYVIDRLVSHRVTADGQMLLRVRWFGYDSHQDT
jgi:hypothetical protein